MTECSELHDQSLLVLEPICIRAEDTYTYTFWRVDFLYRDIYIEAQCVYVGRMALCKCKIIRSETAEAKAIEKL